MRKKIPPPKNWVKVADSSNEGGKEAYTPWTYRTEREYKKRKTNLGIPWKARAQTTFYSLPSSICSPPSLLARIHATMAKDPIYIVLDDWD